MLDAEASAFFGDTSLGDDWIPYHQKSPTANDNTPHLMGVGQTVKLNDGQSTSVEVKPYADAIVRLVSSAPVTIVTAAGGGQVRLKSTTGPELDRQHVTTLTLCEPGATCSCPSGALDGAATFATGDLAIAGGPSGASVTISARCTLPPVPCESLALQADFPPPGPEFGPTEITQADLPGSQSVDGFISGTSCTLDAEIAPGVTPQPLGFYDVASFDSASDAQKALALIEQDAYVGLGNPTSPTDAGDEAFTSEAGGGVQVSNLVFYFRWLPKSDADNAVDPASVLQSVAATLAS